jgi:UDP-N-acetylmuramate dehydrogenase
MNAGVTMTADDTNLTRRISSISDSVLQVTVLDSHGDIRRLSRRSIRFGYRSSSLTKYIILGARLACRTVGPKRVRSSVTKLLEYRRKAHNVRFPNAGCFFKNPSGASAGKLIDACGLKHRMVGGAMVSGAHANYLVNYDAATAADVLRLMKVVTDAVRKKFKISLQPEITIWKN